MLSPLLFAYRVFGISLTSHPALEAETARCFSATLQRVLDGSLGCHVAAGSPCGSEGSFSTRRRRAATKRSYAGCSTGENGTPQLLSDDSRGCNEYLEEVLNMATVIGRSPATALPCEHKALLFTVRRASSAALHGDKTLRVRAANGQYG